MTTSSLPQGDGRRTIWVERGKVEEGELRRVFEKHGLRGAGAAKSCCVVLAPGEVWYCERVYAGRESQPPPADLGWRK